MPDDLEQARAAEARLRASEGEQRTIEARIYADWLQSRGDPRGQIGALALDDMEAERDELVERSSGQLFGAAAALLDGAELRWFGPVLDSLRLRVSIDRASADQLAKLLATPACACLRRLTIVGKVAGEIADDHQPSWLRARLGEAVAAAECAPGLRALGFRSNASLTLAGDRFERLETLTVEGGVLTLGPARLPALRELTVDVHPPMAPLVTSFVELDTPQLDRLVLRVRDHDFWDQNWGPLQANLVELLGQPGFAGIRTLELASYLPMWIGFANQLTRIVAQTRIEHIDLRGAQMTPECRAELDACRDRLPPLQLPPLRLG